VGAWDLQAVGWRGNTAAQGEIRRSGFQDSRDFGFWILDFGDQVFRIPEILNFGFWRSGFQDSRAPTKN
jgi:hypothetical protein